MLECSQTATVSPVPGISVVMPDFQRYQVLEVLLCQFPSDQFIFDGVRQTLVESSNQCRRIPTNLSA